MPSVLGQTLIDLGKRYPETKRSNRRLSLLDAERIRRQRLEDEREKRASTEFSQSQEDREVELRDIEAARGSLDEFQRLSEQAEAAQEGPFLPRPEGPEMELGNIPSGAYRPDKPTRYELGVRAELPTAAGVLPQAKSLWKSIENERGVGRGQSVYDKKSAELRRIRAMPEGPEKEAAFDDFLMTAATGTAYGLSDEGISRAGKKASTVEFAKVPGKTAAADSTTRAKIQAEKDEGRPVTEMSARRLGGFAASVGQMDAVLEGIKNPDSPQGPIAQWRKLNPYDWRAQGKQQLIAASKQLVGKALEEGVLRKEDEIKYEKILPKIGDTYNAAVLKSRQVIDMLDISYKAYLNSLSNADFDVSKYPKKLVYKRGYSSLEEAEAANLPAGTVIYINGRKAVVE